MAVAARLVANCHTLFTLLYRCHTCTGVTPVQVWMMFFADTGTLPPPFNLIPNPRVLYDLARWVVHKVRRGVRGDVEARCSAYRCCYLQRRRATPAHDEDAYQLLMSTLIQRYFLAVADAKNDSSNNSSSQEPSSTKG